MLFSSTFPVPFLQNIPAMLWLKADLQGKQEEFLKEQHNCGSNYYF